MTVQYSQGEKKDKNIDKGRYGKDALLHFAKALSVHMQRNDTPSASIESGKSMSRL